MDVTIIIIIIIIIVVVVVIVIVIVVVVVVIIIIVTVIIIIVIVVVVVIVIVIVVVVVVVIIIIVIIIIAVIFRFLSVVVPSSTCGPIRVTTSGFLSSHVAHKATGGCGGLERPWRLEADDGLQINLTMIDFAYSVSRMVVLEARKSNMTEVMI